MGAGRRGLRGGRRRPVAGPPPRRAAARHPQPAPALRGDVRVLERSFQHRPRQGRLPLHEDRRRPPHHPQTRARQLPRNAPRQRAQPRDALVSRWPGEREAHSRGAAQRELRARTHGAAHARSPRRLRAAGCDGSRALPHRLDHPREEGRRLLRQAALALQGSRQGRLPQRSARRRREARARPGRASRRRGKGPRPRDRHRRRASEHSPVHRDETLHAIHRRRAARCRGGSDRARLFRQQRRHQGDAARALCHAGVRGVGRGEI